MWQSKPPAGIQVNHNHPLAYGLVGCWLFNEGEGLRANDLSGNNNVGVLTSFEPMISTSGWIGGRDGISLKFDGVDDSVNCGNNPVILSNINNTFTVEALIYMTNNNTDKGIVAKWLANTGFILYINLLNTLTWQVNLTKINFALSVNTFYHCVGTFNGTKSELFVNGYSKGTNTPAFTVTSDQLYIGRYSSAGTFFNGIIDRVRIWNRVLSGNEILQLFFQPYSMFSKK